MKYLGYLVSAVKYVLVTLILLAVVAAGTFLAYRALERKRIAKMREITGPSAISSIEKLNIGGVDQWIQVRGWNRDHPVLLFVNGPGFTDMPFYYKFDTLLENDFVVVHWDQRGAGKSYSPAADPKSMNVERFVGDTIELSEKLDARFNKKIILAGHSWGSVVGILAASRRPDLYGAYVGIGQVTNMDDDDGSSYRFALGQAAKDHNAKAVRELKEIGPPPWTLKKLFHERKWVARFGGVYHAMTGGKVLEIAAVSPAYTLRDFYGMFMGVRDSVNMHGQMRSYDVEKTVPKLDLPVYFIVGKFDQLTPPDLVGRYYEGLKAPKKEMMVFNHSGHFPQWEEPEEFHEALVRRVLGEQAGTGYVEP